MNQKLIAAAVAGAFALPGVALAQVTISGSFNVGMSAVSIGDAGAGAGGHLGLNTSSNFVRSTGDLKFSMTEDLGGGTSAYALWEIRPVLDGSVGAALDSNPQGSTTPQAYVGLKNNAWGAVRGGNIAIWSSRGDVANTPKAFHHSAANLTDYQQTTAASGSITSTIAGRQRNVVYYESPKMGGLSLNVGYSTSPQGDDADLTVATRKGSGVYFAPEYDAGVVKFGMVNATQKASAATSVYKGNKFYVTGNIGDISTGIVYVTWKGESAAGLDNLKSTSYYVPINYTMGAHTFGYIYGKAGDNKNLAGDQSATINSIAYNYSLSKRTWLSLSRTSLKNAAGAGYDFSVFTGTMDGAAGMTTALGEDLTSTTFGLHHSF